MDAAEGGHTFEVGSRGRALGELFSQVWTGLRRFDLVLRAQDDRPQERCT